MQFYNRLKQKQKQPQQQRQSQSPPDTLGINKPPLVESRSQWNTSVFLVQKWKKKQIQRIDTALHTPFPIRGYINYVQQHSEGFKEELNLDFFKHIFRHFAINAWWIEETRKWKATIPVNILQVSEHTKQNPEYCKLMIQKQFDDLQFYQDILKNAKVVQPPAASRQILEYRKSITYKVLDLHAGLEHKDKSLFQLQDVFVNRIIQLISDEGLQSLGYYDYVTFKNIVQDRIKGLGDAENFARILEIRRQFNNVDQIQKQFDQTVSQWQSGQSQQNKFRRWQQEKTLYSDEMVELAANVGLDANLIRARKNYEMNKTEQNLKELVRIADQIQLSTHKTIMDTLSKIAQEDYNNISDSISKSIIIEEVLQQAREQYQQQQAVIQKEYSEQLDENQPQLSSLQSQGRMTDIFSSDFKSQEKEQHEQNEQSQQSRQPEQSLEDLRKSQPFMQFKSQQQQLQKQIQQQNPIQKRAAVVSENNNRPINSNTISRIQAQSQGQDRMLQSQWSHQSFKSIEDIIKPINQDNQSDEKRKNLEFFKKLAYQDTREINQGQYQNGSINKEFSNHGNTTLQLNSRSNITNSISIQQRNTNNSINEDIKILSEFVQQSRASQKILKEKILNQDKEREELKQLYEELESISRGDKNSDCKTLRSEGNTVHLEDQGNQNRISEQSNRISDSHLIEQDQYEMATNVQLNYGYKISSQTPSQPPVSISNNTTARTSRNTSNYNSTQQTQPKKQKAENIEEVLGENQPTSGNEILKTNELEKKVSANVLSRQTSIRKANKISELKQEHKGENKKSESKHENQKTESKHEKQNGKQQEMKLEINYQPEIKQDESHNNQIITQQSSEHSPQRSRNEFKSPEKGKRFQKSVTKIIDNNKQIKRETELIVKNVDHQDIRKNRQKTGNKEQINESHDDDKDEDEEEKQNELRLRRQKSVKKGQFHSVSMPKIGKEDDTRRYLMMLKEELKDMLSRKVNLKEVKEHINMILSEIAGVKLDPELEYYLQLYKQRVQELSQVSQQSREINFQNLQPTIGLSLKREIKGLKFARNCDRIPKLQPKDLEDTFIIQQTLNEHPQGQFELQQQTYEPIFRYSIKPQPLITNLVQESLDFTRRQTPNTQRVERTGSLIEQELPMLSARKKSTNTSPKKKKYKYLGPVTIKRDKLTEDFPYLQKYKPELLKSILEANICLEQLI